MDLLIAFSLIASVALMFAVAPVQGAEPKPQISHVAWLPGVSGLAVSGMVTAPAGPTMVSLYVGEQDAGTNSYPWKITNCDVYQFAGEFCLPVFGLSPGQKYCFRICAENAGGKTWSEATWVTTKAVLPIKKQNGTVVLVK